VDEAKLTFAQAPPGLAGTVYRRQLLLEMGEQHIPPGFVLNYKPDAPMMDLAFKSCCYTAPEAVRHAEGRLIVDTDRAWQTVDEYLATGQSIEAERIGQWLIERAASHVPDLPRELEIAGRLSEAFASPALVVLFSCVVIQFIGRKFGFDRTSEIAGYVAMSIAAMGLPVLIATDIWGWRLRKSVEKRARALPEKRVTWYGLEVKPEQLTSPEARRETRPLHVSYSPFLNRFQHAEVWIILLYAIFVVMTVLKLLGQGKHTALLTGMVVLGTAFSIALFMFSGVIRVADGQLTYDVKLVPTGQVLKSRAIDLTTAKLSIWSLEPTRLKIDTGNDVEHFDNLPPILSGWVVFEAFRGTDASD